MTQEKSVTTLLRNIHYTLSHIYNHAYGEPECKEEELKISLKWTSYCEKIYSSVLNEPAEEGLNNYIKEMVSRIPNCCVPNADLNFLKYSTKTLYFLLLQNCEMNFIEYANILDKYALFGLEHKVLDIPLYIIKGANPLFEAFNIGGNNIFTYEQWLLLGSGFLLHNLLQRMRKTNNSRMSESTLRSNLDELCRNKTRLRFLLMAAKESKICLSQSMCYKLQNYIIKWCTDAIEKAKNAKSSSETILELITEQPAPLLTDLAISNQEFLQAYLKTLVYHGQKFEPQYKKMGYVWRSCVDSMEFTILVEHFDCLLKKGSNITSLVERILKILSEAEGGSLWDDIHNECLIRQEWDKSKAKRKLNYLLM